MVVAQTGIAGTSGRVRDAERGFTVVEAAVAFAVLAVAAGGALFGISSFGRFATHQPGPVRTAALGLAEQTLRVAQDAWKYGSPGTAPSGTQTIDVPIAIPNNAATSAPVTLTVTVGNAVSGSAPIAVTARYTPDPQHETDSGTLTVSGTLSQRAPAPGSQVQDAAPVAAPSGAP